MRPVPLPSRRELARWLARAAGAGFFTRLGLARPGAAWAGAAAAPDTLPPPASPTLRAIKQRQRLRAGLLVGAAPFASAGSDADEVLALIPADPPPSYKAERGTKVVGLDADLAAAAAQLLGVGLDLVVFERFDELFLHLGRGEIDLALGGISRTAARAVALSFSAPYLTSGQELLTLDEKRFPSLHDVNQATIRVGVRSGTTGHGFALQDLEKAQLRVYPRTAELFQALLQREIDVCVADGLVGRDFALRRKLTLFSVEKRRVTSESIAIAARQGDGDFVEFLSLLIRELRQSGDWRRLARRYNPWLRVDR